MTSFSQLSGANNIKSKIESWKIPTESTIDLIDVPITIVSYEKGIDTSKGTDRIVVRFHEDDNVIKKFWTTSKLVKESLEIIAQSGFPVTATLKQKNLGRGKRAFYLE